MEIYIITAKHGSIAGKEFTVRAKDMLTALAKVGLTWNFTDIKIK